MPLRFWQCAQPCLQIFFYGQQWKNHPALGDISDAQRRPAVCSFSGQISILIMDRAGIQGQKTHDTVEQRGFTDTISADQADATAGLYQHVHIPQRVGLTV